MLVPSNDVESEPSTEKEEILLDVNVASVPIYKTMWFAVVMALIAMILVFSVLAMALRRSDEKANMPNDKRIPLGMRTPRNISPRSDLNFGLNNGFQGDGSLLNYSVRVSAFHKRASFLIYCQPEMFLEFEYGTTATAQ